MDRENNQTQQKKPQANQTNNQHNQINSIKLSNDQQIIWENLLKKQSQTINEKIPEQFLLRLKSKILKYGYFSQFVEKLLAKSLNNSIFTQFHNIYQTQIKTFLFLKLTQYQFDIQYEIYYQLVQLIKKNDKQKIQEMLGEYIDTISESFESTKKFIFNFCREKTQDDQQKENQKNNQEMKQQQSKEQDIIQKKIRLIKEQKEQFSYLLINAKVQLNQQIVSQIIELKHQKGSFSKEIDQLIKNIPDLKPIIKNKISKIFKEKFRSILLTQKIKDKFTLYKFAEVDIKFIIDIVQKGDQQKIKDYVKKYVKDINQQNIMVKQLNELIPEELRKKQETVIINSQNQNIKESQQKQNKNQKNQKNLQKLVQQQEKKIQQSTIKQQQIKIIQKNQQINIQEQGCQQIAEQDKIQLFQEKIQQNSTKNKKETKKSGKNKNKDKSKNENNCLSIQNVIQQKNKKKNQLQKQSSNIIQNKMSYNEIQQIQQQYQSIDNFDRYILIHYQKDTPIQITHTNSKSFKQFKPIFEYTFKSSIKAAIIKLEYNRSIFQYYITGIKKKTGINFWNNNNIQKYTINNQRIFNKHFFQFQFVQQKCISSVKNIVYYIVILNQLTKQYKKNNRIIKQVNQKFRKQKSKFSAIQSNLEQVNKIFKQKRYQLTGKCSKILLQTFIYQYHMGKKLLEYQSVFATSFATMTNFQTFQSFIYKYGSQQSQKYQLLIIIYLTFRKLKYSKTYSPLSLNNLIHNISIFYSLEDNINQKLGILVQISQALPHMNLYQKNQNFKDIILLKNMPIGHFIILRLHLLIYSDYNYNSIQFKRKTILQFLNQIYEHLIKLNQIQIKKQSQSLEIFNFYTNLINDVCLGKNYGYIFDHKSFYYYYRLLNRIQDETKINLKIYFLTQIQAKHLINSANTCIRDYQINVLMIPYLCSFKKGHQIINDFLKQVNYCDVKKILLLVQNWFREFYVPQFNNHFNSVFIQFLNLKNQFSQMIQLLKLLTQLLNTQKGQKYQNILCFAKKVFENSKQKFFIIHNLKNHLIEIKDQNCDLKYIYLNSLAKRMQKSDLSIRDIQIIGQQLINQKYLIKKDKDIILSQLFKNRHDKNLKSIKKQIIQSLAQKKKFKEILIYYPKFNQALKTLLQQVQENDIQYNLIMYIKSPSQYVFQVQREKLNQLLQYIIRVKNKVQQLKQQFNKLFKILDNYQQKFNLEKQQIKQWKVLLAQQKISFIVQKSAKFKDILNQTSQIYTLIKIPLWKHQKIQTLEDFSIVKLQTRQLFQNLIKDFYSGQLLFIDFQKYFRIDIIKILQQVNRNQDFSKINQYVYLLDINTLKHTHRSMLALNKLSYMLNDKQIFEQNKIEIVKIFFNPNQNLTIQLVYLTMKQIQQIFKSLDFNILNEKQQILKIMIYFKEHESVFKMIDQKISDSDKILDDLKQYINDVEYSLVKIQDIKQLQNIVNLNKIISDADSLKQFLKTIRNQVQSKSLKLSENILNISAKIKSFQQIIDSTNNRQTSFKYEIQQIFNNSMLIIKQQKGYAKIYIQIIPQQKIVMSQNLNNKIEMRQKILDFKKLTQIKQKAILSVSNFQRYDQNKTSMKQTISIFKNYVNLYEFICEIQTILEKLIIYGYNPDQLGKHYLIKNDNYQFIKQVMQNMKQLSKDWINFMKKSYKQSYVLTHFMGPKLNKFIDQTINFKFSPLIKSILNLEQQQIAQHFKKYINIQEKYNIKQRSNIKDPIKKVQKVCEIYRQIESKYQKIQIPCQKLNKKKIQLITCHRVQYYYYALIKKNDKIQMNQILYCQNQTTIQEIQVFLKRAIIRFSNKHYFIGVHYLSPAVQLKFVDLLNEFYKSQQNKQKFLKCKLVFIDNSTTQKVYLHLCKKNLFSAEQITDAHLKSPQQEKAIIDKIGQACLIESKIAGLGKTFVAQRIVPNSNVIHFPVSGSIDFNRLLERLNEKEFKQDQNNTLILQIGNVQNKIKLQIFLFQLIFFKGFNFKQFFFLPSKTTIIVEIQNINDQKQNFQYYPILKIMKANKNTYQFIQQFRIENLQINLNKVQEAFVFSYFKGISNGSINNKQISYSQFNENFNKNQNKKNLIPIKQLHQLVKTYFLDLLLKNNTEPTYSLYKSFMKLIFIAFKTFSMNPCFYVEYIEQNHRVNKYLKLNEFRIHFLRTCILNSLQFLLATINTNQFQENIIESMDQMEQKSKNIDFRDKLKKFPFLIVPNNSLQSYQFVYLNAGSVDISIKSLIISQTIYKYIKSNKSGYKALDLQNRLDQQKVAKLFGENSLDNLKDEQLQAQIFRIFHSISGNDKFQLKDNLTLKKWKQNFKQIRNYSLTLDNFFKMCLIIQRGVSNIPIIIMGESGVGKTALIKFLIQVVFQQQLLVFNIHAGIDQNQLIKIYQKIIQKYQQVTKKYDYLKKRKYQIQNQIENIQKIKPLNENQKNQIHQLNQQLNKSEYKYLARKKNIKLWVFFDQFNTTSQLGYIKQMIIDRRFQGQPLPENIVFLSACNPYRNKRQSNIKSAGIKKRAIQNKNTKNLINLAFKVNPPPFSMIQLMWDYQQLQQHENFYYISKILQQLELKNHKNAVLTLCWLHEQFKKNQEISSISLRDVSRFKQIYVWFLQYMDKQNIKQNQQRQQALQQKALSLSIAFCYSLRIADLQYRQLILKKIQKKIGFKHDIYETLIYEQLNYVKKFKIQQQKIALNYSLRQNVFTTFVCIMNKIPILIIGEPGNSKSLSLRMIYSNLKGVASDSDFCKRFPQLNTFYFQGSQACTSKGVEAIFQKAIKSYLSYLENKKIKQSKDEKVSEVQNCIIFDQIGLAQNSIHNPLKVLHAKLESNIKNICFIGISNWQLDAAKMSRCLVLSRPSAQIQQLKQTGYGILQSYLGDKQSQKYKKQCEQLVEWYYQFIKKWNKDNQNTPKQGFFGMRDFYSYIKHFGGQLQKNNDQRSIQQIKRNAIYSNFNGQQESIKCFMEISKLPQSPEDFFINPIELVQRNLSKYSSRYLLLIVKGDALLPIINQKIIINGQKRRVQCIYGSSFQQDQQSQIYNLQVTSALISHMSRGTILTFKNPNNSIQTSLYDVFNKSFIRGGNKNYCRVAVGANSNNKAYVNDKFGVVVYIDQQMLQYTDLAFLNRFQKHFLTLNSVLSSNQKQIVKKINEWINQLLVFKEKTEFKKQQNYLINSSQQSISTLVIKFRGLQQQQIVKNIKKTLLKNATQHFYIALKDDVKTKLSKILRNQIYQLLKQISQKQINLNQSQNQSKNKIIFTYDEGIFSAQNYLFCTQKTQKIRISQIKSQRQLRNWLTHAFSSDQIDNIHILIDFEKQIKHMNLIGFLVTSYKNDFKSKGKKEVYIIIKLSQISLNSKDKNHINISYLLDFEQKFIDSMTLGKSLIQLVQGKNLKEFYEERQLQQNFNNYYYEAQMRFRILQKNHSKKSIIPLQNRRQFQFNSMMKMIQNKTFNKTAKQFVYNNLSSAKINLSIILYNKQDRNICSSPQESFQKYLQNCIINLICYFFEKVYNNSIFFGFDIDKLIEFYRKHYQIPRIQKILKNKEIYNKFFENLLLKYGTKVIQQIKSYHKRPNSNLIQMKDISLLPMSLIDFNYIQNTNEDSFINSASKILELSIQQDEEKNNDQLQNRLRECHLSLQHCMSILKNKSIFFKKSNDQIITFDYENALNSHIELQILYFFDLISKLYGQSFTNSTKYLQRIVVLFINIFSKINVKQKIILLLLHKQLWTSIFNLLNVWIQKDKYFCQKIQPKFKIDFQFSRGQQFLYLPNIFKDFCGSILIIFDNLLEFQGPTFQQYGIKTFLSLFKNSYFYLQKIKISCDQLNIIVPQDLKIRNRFLTLLQKIFKKQQVQKQLYQFLTIQEHQFAPKVQIYLHSILKSNKKIQKQIQMILSYLSLQIYPKWINSIKAQQNYQVSQVQRCLNSFVNFSNQYSFFANNSTLFLDNIFQELIQNVQTFQQKIQFIEDQIEHNLFYKILNSLIRFQDNFSVSLGNTFMTQIKQLIEQQEQNNTRQIQIRMAEQNQDAFLDKYYNFFERLLKQKKSKNNILTVFLLQFSKFYCLKYLQSINLGQNSKMIEKINTQLSSNSQHHQLIKLYLLKNILKTQKNVQTIKDKYFDRYNWMDPFKNMILGNTFEELVPPSFEEEQKILSLIHKFRQQEYQNNETFLQMINQSFKNPYAKYEFFTFMMNDIYPRLCTEDKFEMISQTINKHQAYINGANQIQYFLLKCYLKQQITYKLIFKKGFSQSLNKKKADFTNQQLVYINYINIIVACNRQQCPLIQTFFDLNGNIPQKYQQWLENRFLITGQQNPSVSILNDIIQRNDPSSGYYLCSSQCDFFYAIGGGTYGCQRPKIKATCPWCNKVIGGQGHILQRMNQGAKQYLIDKQLNQLLQVRQQMRQKKKMTIKSKQVKLNGFGYKMNLQQNIAWVQQNGRISKTVKYILQQIFFTIWEFLIHNNMIEKNQIQSIFKVQTQIFQDQAQRHRKYYYKQINKPFNENDNQNNLIWHLGLSKLLMNFILNYKNSLTQPQKMKMGLEKCFGRDLFEQKLSNIILPVSNGNQRLDFLNKNRFIKSGLNLSNHSILREVGRHQIHLNEYPKIRMIKLVEESKRPSYENLISQYSETIKKQYPILSFYISNQENIQKLQDFRKIYLFVTKLCKMFNFKITRQQAQKKSILQNYQNLLKNQNQQFKKEQKTIKDFTDKVQEFCYIWNKYRNMKYELQYNCHSFGVMSQVTEQLSIRSPLRSFLPDSKFKGDQKGQMLISFLQVTAHEYNVTCQNIENLKLASKKYHQLQIFDKKQLTPTQIYPFTNTLILLHQDVEQFIYHLSNWAVQYGCYLPYYSIQKIESLIVEKMIGSHILNQNIKQYDTICYIGQEFNFIRQIRNSPNQLNWELIDNRQQIQKYIFNLKKEQPTGFLKEIITLKGSLQIILKYLNLQNEEQIYQIPLQYFIMKNNIQISSKLLKEEIFRNISLKFIIGFYQFIELHTLLYSADCIDPSYQKLKLNEDQKIVIDKFLEQLPNYYKAQQQIYYNLCIGLYRFVARYLSLVQIFEQQILLDYLTGDGSDLWPKNFDNKKLEQIPGFRQAFELPLTKMGDLLVKFPLELKQSKFQALINDEIKLYESRQSIQSISPDKNKNKKGPVKRKGF